MKKRHFILSIMTIVLCLTLISGATFALFTSESKVNISVTSGKVSVESVVENLELYSMEVQQTNKFENGGTASYQNGVLKLDKMTPGDKAKFQIKVTNSSDINIKYRLRWSVSGLLSDALVATVDGQALSNVAWTEWKADAAEKEIIMNVVVELPVETNDDYQEKSCEIVFSVEAIQSNGILKNYVTPATINDALANAQEGDAIELSEGFYSEIVVPINGITLLSNENAVVGYLNVNGKDNITIKGLTFDAANAKVIYDGKGNGKQYTSIAAASGKANGKGALNLVIDECKFTGAFANGGTSIAFTDQGRTTGPSGNITIKNCTFETTGGYYDIYFHYSGKGTLTIENNIFNSSCLGNSVFIGRYQSSTPVEVKGNAFNTKSTLDEAVYIQDHSNYGVSLDASDNTFN